MLDERDEVYMCGQLFRGIREEWDNGFKGHIQLNDYVTDEPVVRVIHNGSDGEMEIMTFGKPVPRSIVDELFKRAGTYLG